MWFVPVRVNFLLLFPFQTRGTCCTYTGASLLANQYKAQNMKRKANAQWKGTGMKGEGTLNSPSGVLDQTPYSFKLRFENESGKAGTNPEELIAAAHSGCYAMALSVAIEQAGYTADQIDAEAIVQLDQVDGGFAVTKITLEVKGSVSGMSENQFLELAEGAKQNCPISKALSAVPIELKASFQS